MVNLLILLLFLQGDTLEIKFNSQLQILQNFPDQSEIVVQQWIKGGESIFPLLLKTFTKPNTPLFVKEKIAIALGGIKKREALTSLYQYLRSSSSELRANCARAIGDICDTSSIDFLIPLLRDPHDAVRGAAIYAIGRLKSKRALPYVIEALKDSVFMNQSYALIALGEIGDASVIPSLRVFQYDQNAALRISLAKALAILRDLTSLDILEMLSKDTDPLVRKEAFIAIGKLPDERSKELFKNGINDPDPLVREGLITVLSEYPPEFSLPILYQFVNDEYVSVQETARNALKSIGNVSLDGFEFILKENFSLDIKRWALTNLISLIGEEETTAKLMVIFPNAARKRTERITRGEYEKGMTQEEVYLSLGKPSRTRKVENQIEEWDYDQLNLILKFQGNVLIEAEKI